MVPKKNAIRECPLNDCNKPLMYLADGGHAVCEAGHEFETWGGFGAGLRQVLPGVYERGKVIYMDPDAHLATSDLLARTWNALVNFSNNKHKFWGKLLDVMYDFAEEARIDYPEGTQMGHEIRLIEFAEEARIDYPEGTQMDHEIRLIESEGWKRWC